jgi:hypothetical protein
MGWFFCVVCFLSLSELTYFGSNFSLVDSESFCLFYVDFCLSVSSSNHLFGSSSSSLLYNTKKKMDWLAAVKLLDI